MAKQDFYEVLGVDRGADEKALKSAFRRLAMRYHPDKNPGDVAAEKKFKELNEAYSVLSDKQKRSAYDRFGHEAFSESAARGGAGGFGTDFSSSMSDIFDDLFGDMVGRARGGGAGSQHRGNDLRYDHRITLEEAHSGGSAEITVKSPVSCETCDATGAKPGSSPVTCQQCAGRGRVRTSSGFLSIERTCSACRGEGVTIAQACPTCRGQGRVAKRRTIAFRIPPGIDDGMRIRIAGEGEGGLRGGPAGDLYVFIHLSPHRFFKRRDRDLFCSIPIRFPLAALGGEIEVPTIDKSRARVSVPRGIQSGTLLRLRGKGMPSHNSTRVGDMQVEIKVETPRNLTREQQDLLRQFEQLSEDENSPEASGFFDKVKSLWMSIALMVTSLLPF